MQVTLERTRIVCDQCDELRHGIILGNVEHEGTDHEEINSIQLCNECASYFAREILGLHEEW